jgi:hypothetical protein
MKGQISKNSPKGFEKTCFTVLKLMKALIILGMLQACNPDKGSGMLKLGENSNVNYIIIPDHADQVVQFAASELRNYLKKITGKEMEILTQSVARRKKNAVQLVVEKSESLKWDGFTMEITGKHIRLISGESRGLLYAVYYLLEESGCSFFYPGENEEIIPRKAEIVFNPVKITCNPTLENRGLAPYGLYAGSVEMGRKFIDWMAKNRLNFILVSEDRPSDCDGPAHGSIWKEVQKDLLPELQKRGFIIEMSEHCAPVFFQRSLFKDHPDWFAMSKGKRKLGPPPYSGQMCYSNKDAVEYYATAIAEYAAKHPEFHVIGTWPLDGGEYCECENCKDPQTVFKAVMRVAEKVRKVRPDMMVEHLAYKVQTWQPPVQEEIPGNMSVLWCQDSGDRDSLVLEWIRKAAKAGGVYQFEYYMGDNYRTRANVWLRPEYAVGVARHAREMGYRGVISLFLPIQNWWRASFNNWFFARACWEEDLDIDESIRNYCLSYYGAQGPEIEKIFARILNNLQPEPYKDQRENAAERLNRVRVSAQSIMDKLDSILKETADKDVAIRIQRLRTYVEYSLMHCEAMASRKPADLKRLSDYSKDHPEQQMVLMYPEYIVWRNSD